MEDSMRMELAETLGKLEECAARCIKDIAASEISALRYSAISQFFAAAMKSSENLDNSVYLLLVNQFQERADLEKKSALARAESLKKFLNLRENCFYLLEEVERIEPQIISITHRSKRRRRRDKGLNSGGIR